MKTLFSKKFNLLVTLITTIPLIESIGTNLLRLNQLENLLLLYLPLIFSGIVVLCYCFTFLNEVLDFIRSFLDRTALIKQIVVFILVVLFQLSNSYQSSAQEITQSVVGQVYDEVTKETLPFANVIVKDSEPIIATIANEDGYYKLENIGIGRISIQFSMIGYETYEMKEVLISSGQFLQIDAALQQSNTKLEEVIVRVNKSSPINSMATVSSKQFSVEEAQRFAGGMDDPARLVTAFAGVSNPSISDNGISIRGNSPDGLLWRIEGVEVPNPNHFANLTIAGGGLLSGISNQIMGNSDFFTGAFPAEFGNASSGVFDIRLKEGNRYQHQHSLEAGILGVGVMSQGPINKSGKATYIVNYRNSTMALLAPLLPNDAGILKYQDLAFKSKITTKKYGNFTIWGLGMKDGVKNEAIDSSLWESNFDKDNSRVSMNMYAAAISHNLGIFDNSYLKSSFAVSGNGLNFNEDRYDYNLNSIPQSRINNRSRNYTFKSELSTRISDTQSHKAGLRLSFFDFQMDAAETQLGSEILKPLSNQQGSTLFVQLYSQSKIRLTPKIDFNLGINNQYLALNNSLSIEPRLGLKYQITNHQSIGLAYGVHSRMEQLPIYFAIINGDMPNKNLDIMKSSHYVLSYHKKVSANVHLKIEPYYQSLNQVPVSPDGYASTLNNNNALFFNEKLVSTGKARNLGIDLTLEKFLDKGYYYILSASVFDTKYTTTANIRRNTRFNRNLVVNATAGKEWKIKGNNLLGFNIRVNYMGGKRKEPIDMIASMQQKDIVYGESEGKIAFNEKHNALPIISTVLSYRKNKKNYSSIWSLKILNITGSKEHSKDFFNLKTNMVDSKLDDLIIPNLSYRIEF